MRKVAISYPLFFDGEAAELVALLEQDHFWRVHLRKPGSRIDEMEALIQAIPKKYYPQLTLHDHFQLAKKYCLGGVHLNSRNPIPPENWNGLVSRSLHCLEEIAVEQYDYAFLSPVYPSISKPGYKEDFSLKQLKGALNNKVFALGGVTPERYEEIDELGFGGVALHGILWKRVIDPRSFLLQFITHPSPNFSIVEEAEMALKGGCRWIQLRNKNASMEQIVEDGNRIKELCNEYGAVFIIDDYVELVESIGADGVHLGKNDMPVNEARKLLGPHKIIGATANCYADVKNAIAKSADYIGLGPYQFTTTKSNLSPVLGLPGYEKIEHELSADGVIIPIVAIGGITSDDIEDIMATGVNGVAISSEIIKAKDSIEKTRTIINKLYLCQS